MAKTRQADRLVPVVFGRVVVVLAVCFVAIPVLYMVSLSFSPQLAISSGAILPSRIDWSNYINIWAAAPLARGFLNSFIICGTSAVIAVFVASIGAYPLARCKFLGRGAILYGALGLQLVPGPMILLPLFVVFAMLQTIIGIVIIGSYWGVIVTYVASSLPLALWLMVTYLRTIPVELEEAVFVDGGTPWSALMRVVLPIAVPGMVVALLFSLLLGWNDVLFATILTNNGTRTLAVDLQVFTLTEEGFALPQYGQLMAAAVVTALPIVLIYMGLQRYLITGIGAGALK